MKFAKIRNVKSPQKGTPQSSGIDFFVPLFDTDFYNDFVKKNDQSLTRIVNNSIRIEGHGRALIPSGIRVRIPANSALIAFNKSGISSKAGLDVLACVVDSDYQGEVHLSVLNTTNSPVFIEESSKLVQFILIPNYSADPDFQVKEVLEEELYDEKTIRGEGGFGHTDD